MRKFPASPQLNRSIEKVEARVEIVIACEGLVTEPDYLRKCISHYGAGMVRLRVMDDRGVPITLVNLAVAERERLLAKYRKNRDLSLVNSCFKVWVIFDKDEHEVEEALALAAKHKIGVAFSNPCFELWPILHLREYGSQDGRHALQRLLSEHMPSYDHEGDPKVDFDAIKDKFDIAYERALHLNRSREAEGCIGGCPSTTVGELVLKIRQNGRVNERRIFARKSP